MKQKQDLKKRVGQVVALHTDKGLEVGILDKVTDQGVILKKLPKQAQKDIKAEHVFMGYGYYPYAGMYGGYGGYGAWGGYGGYGMGMGMGMGVGVGVGVGMGVGFGGGGLFW